MLKVMFVNPLVKFFQGVPLASLEGDLVLVLGLRVKVRDGVSGGAEGGVQTPLHIL